MKHHIRTLGCGVALLAAFALAACGGKQTMASKSAAAYDDARKKGIPIEAGEHGGHSAEPAGSDAAVSEPAMPGMNHGAAPGTDQAKMPGTEHSAMAGMDHSKMPGMPHASAAAGTHDMAGMNHSAMPGMESGSAPAAQHGGSMAAMPGMQHASAAASARDMAGMNHSAMPGMDHGSAGTQHPGSMAAMPGMEHGSTPAAPIVIAPPVSNAAIAQTQPAETLRPDEIDAPAPAAVLDAAKAASGVSHSMDKMAPSPAAVPQHEHPAKPPSEHHHHGAGEAS